LDNIRVTYSGLIAFIVGLISVLTGLLFAIIVARNLSPEEFGTWSLIFSIISYFIISEHIIHFWTVRQVARGEEVGKTSVVSTTFFSIGAIPFYLIVAYVVSSQANTEFDSMFLAVILVPLFFVSRILRGINTAHRPQATSYSLLIFETTKIPAALAFVYFLDLGLDGAIFAVIIAYIIQIAVQFYFAKPKLHNKFDFLTLKRWIKLSWISLYNQLHGFIATLDILIYTLLIGSVIGVAFYAVSLAIANITIHAGKISQALYPKLLANGSFLHLQKNYSLLLYFAIPLLGLSIIFSKPALYSLNPAYQEASLIVIILAFSSFFSVLTETLRKAFIGIDKVDVEKDPKFSKLLKSKLFFNSTVSFLKSISYLAILIPVLLIMNSAEKTELELVTAWAIVVLAIELPFFAYFWIIIRKNIPFLFPYLDAVKYVGATVAFILVFLLTSEFLITYEESIFDFFPGIIFQAVICIGVYLVITYTIDKKTQKLFKSVIQELIFKK